LATTVSYRNCNRSRNRSRAPAAVTADLLGSHYDNYVIVFYQFVPTLANISEALFLPPQSMMCGDFPGQQGLFKCTVARTCTPSSFPSWSGPGASHGRGGLAIISDEELETKARSSNPPSTPLPA
jgi:hypothetical protein